ncbi:MAG: NAD(P)H-dependent glycerol-3-phosphate dehydrogenase [Kosmotogaceae bacterium]
MKFNADKMTFLRLAGIGKLVVTCTRKYSRNRYVGQKIAEGAFTSKAMHRMSIENQIELTIPSEVYKVLYENKPPEKVLNSLMKRWQKDESSF